MIEITEISAIVAAAGVLVGVAYYIMDIQNQAKIRKTDMVLRFDTVWTSKDFLEAWTKVLERETKEYDTYRLNNTSHWLPELQVASFFEDMGFLLHKGLLDPELFTLFSISQAWEKLKPLIERMREDRNIPKLFESFEYLYNEMKKREQVGVKNG
jgi:hypothetical protein